MKNKYAKAQAEYKPLAKHLFRRLDNKLNHINTN